MSIAAVAADHNYASQNTSVTLGRLISYPLPSPEDVKILLNSGFDVNYAVPPDSQYKTEWIGNTLLHLLVESKHAASCNKIIKLLSERGANLLCKNGKGFTPLRLAFESHKDKKNLLSPKVKLLINELLNCQLHQGNSSNPRCSQGISHFHIACLAGNRRVVKFFLDNNASINETINSDSSVFPGCSGLHLATFSENKNTVHLLLEHGADSTRLNARGLTPLHLVIEKQLDDCSFKGTDKQLKAKMERNEYVLNELSKPSAANPNPIDCIGLSHVHVCCLLRYNFKVSRWKDLLSAGIDLNAPIKIDSSVWQGYTPMHFAACCNLDTMILLLKNGANPFVKAVNDLTPIDLCLDRCKPTDVSRIFNACSALQSIKFQDESRLVDALIAFETNRKLKNYLRNIDVNKATIPLDSPLWPGWTLLHLAVKLTQESDDDVTFKMSLGSENYFQMEACLEAGVSLTAQDKNKMTALHLAFYMNKKKCTFKILNVHADNHVNPVDKNGLSHCQIACITNSRSVVEMFLSQNVDPNTTLQMDTKSWNKKCIKAGSTLLHIAANVCSPSMVYLLLQKKADPHRLDDEGLTCIHRLLPHCWDSGNYYSINQTLLESVHSEYVAPGGLSYLHVACSARAKEAVEALLPLTANINQPIGIESMRYFDEHENFKCLDTPLHLASRCHLGQSVEIIDLLLKNGADITAKNADGLNPLQVALFTFKNDHYLSMDTYHTKRAIERLAFEYDEKNMFPDDIGLTRLHVACSINNFSTIQELLLSGESTSSRMTMDSPLWPGETPLHLLIKKGCYIDKSTLKLFLHHIILELTDQLDYQPLHESTKRQKMSLPESYDLVVNRERLSVLHIICMGSNVGIVKSFINLGLDFNVPKDFLASEDAGFYPLHFAIKYGSDSIAELLLKNKINVDCQDAQGNSPIHLAALNYNKKLEVFVRNNEFNGGVKKNLYNKSVIDLILDKHREDWKTITDVSAKMQLATTLMSKFSGQILRSLIESISNVSDVDTNGQNIIYHTIRLYKPGANFNMLQRNIDLLIRMGYELDLQDNKGQTALHCAAQREKYNGILVLLTAGADINIIDCCGKTPLNYYYDSRSSRYKSDTLLTHVSKLKACGLYVNELNIKYVEIDQKYSLELSEMEDCIITKSFTLREILTEKMVMKFPMMPKPQRKAILNYLKSDNMNKFNSWQGIFNYQQIRALKREKLYNATFESLQGFLDPRLPDHCLDSVLIHLSNEDWKNIISC